MKNISKLSLVIILTIFLSGCGQEAIEENFGKDTINPLNPDSMVNTYENSKEKIGDSVQKENDKINKALEESGLNLE
jgi:PBP1b-binding outer membrane lipoprotein LpoB